MLFCFAEPIRCGMLPSGNQRETAMTGKTTKASKINKTKGSPKELSDAELGTVAGGGTAQKVVSKAEPGNKVAPGAKTVDGRSRGLSFGTVKK
jgi:hypothetical protein